MKMNIIRWNEDMVGRCLANTGKSTPNNVGLTKDNVGNDPDEDKLELDIPLESKDQDDTSIFGSTYTQDNQPSPDTIPDSTNDESEKWTKINMSEKSNHIKWSEDMVRRCLTNIGKSTPNDENLSKDNMGNDPDEGKLELNVPVESKDQDETSVFDSIYTQDNQPSPDTIPDSTNEDSEKWTKIDMAERSNHIKWNEDMVRRCFANIGKSTPNNEDLSKETTGETSILDITSTQDNQPSPEGIPDSASDYTEISESNTLEKSSTENDSTLSHCTLKQEDEYFSNDTPESSVGDNNDEEIVIEATHLEDNNIIFCKEEDDAEPIDLTINNTDQPTDNTDIDKLEISIPIEDNNLDNNSIPNTCNNSVNQYVFEDIPNGCCEKNRDKKSHKKKNKTKDKYTALNEYIEKKVLNKLTNVYGIKSTTTHQNKIGRTNKNNAISNDFNIPNNELENIQDRELECQNIISNIIEDSTISNTESKSEVQQFGEESQTALPRIQEFDSPEIEFGIDDNNTFDGNHLPDKSSSIDESSVRSDNEINQLADEAEYHQVEGNSCQNEVNFLNQDINNTYDGSLENDRIINLISSDDDGQQNTSIELDIQQANDNQSDIFYTERNMINTNDKYEFENTLNSIPDFYSNISNEEGMEQYIECQIIIS